MISELSVSCTTFNILAPIYKRHSEKDQSCRESQYRGYWLSRNERIIDRLLEDQSSTICLKVYKILQSIKTYQKENNLSPIPIVLCGDWNGSKRGQVYKFLRSQGFVSSYDAAHCYTDSDADCHSWVSHRNHHGNVCGVDFIWLLNPNKSRKPLRTSWKEAVFGIIKSLLQAASLSEENAFAFLKADSPGDYITYPGFFQALHQLGLIGHRNGLIPEDAQDLWTEADIDGNGMVDHEEFQQRIWCPRWSEHPQESIEQGTEWGSSTAKPVALGFSVKDAILFPPEVEKGMWPENYSLSDHAPLTVVFSPVKLSFSPQSF